VGYADTHITPNAQNAIVVTLMKKNSS